MNIVVLVKTVPDSEARISVKSDASGLEIEDKYELNYFDELAVEEALRLRELSREGSVIAVTYGGRRALEGIRKAVAMGADEAIHVEARDEEAGHGLATARVLARCIESIPFDLVLCGRKATDDDSSQVGPMVAELLGLPHISSAVEIEVKGDQRTLTVLRDYEGGKERIRCPLPALISAQKGLNEPRVPTIQGVMKGMKLQPKKMDPVELGLTDAGGPCHWKVIEFSEASRKPPVKMIDGPDPAARARELLRLMREEMRITE